MSSKRHEGKSNSLRILCLLYAIFIRTVHGIQSMFGNLFDFISNFIMKHEKTVHNTRKKIYFEKLPARPYELKISCNHLVVWSGGFSCPPEHFYLIVTFIGIKTFQIREDN